MTLEELKEIIKHGESVRVEFKEAEQGMPPTLFETVCAFLNKEGGTIVLGVDDQKNIRGITPHSIDQIIKDIVSTSNNPEVLDPPFTLSPQRIDDEIGPVLVLKIPVSSQVHRYRNVVYDRENDSDLRITDGTRLGEMYFRKRQTYTETQIYPALRFEDLNSDSLKKARSLIRARKPDHPWLEEDDQTLLRRANLFRRDFQTGEEGYTLAAALVFGTDEVIQSILPAYKLDAIVRIKDIDRFDDRITLRTNLIDSYDQLMAFVAKHLPDKFYLEGDQRQDLRTIIFREIVANIIVHREYTNALPSQFIIYKDRVETTNPNIVHFRGPLTLVNFSPYPKNPNIAKLFVELGRVDELGSGLRNVNKYLPHYSGGAKPIFIEDDIFKTVIPLITYKFQVKLLIVLKHFGIKLSDLPKGSVEALNELDLDPELSNYFHDDDLFVSRLIYRYVVNGLKLKDLELLNPKELREFEAWSAQFREGEESRAEIKEGTSSKELGPKPAKSDSLKSKDLQASARKVGVSLPEKGPKLPGRRFSVFVKALFAMSVPTKVDTISDTLEFKSTKRFKERYLTQLLNVDLIQRTIPEKPTSPEQKYVLTDKGKLFLGGFPI